MLILQYIFLQGTPQIPIRNDGQGNLEAIHLGYHVLPVPLDEWLGPDQAQHGQRLRSFRHAR